MPDAKTTKPEPKEEPEPTFPSPRTAIKAWVDSKGEITTATRDAALEFVRQTCGTYVPPTAKQLKKSPVRECAGASMLWTKRTVDAVTRARSFARAYSDDGDRKLLLDYHSEATYLKTHTSIPKDLPVH